MTCPKCEKELAQGSIVCPYCLTKVVKQKKKCSAWKIILAVVVVAAALAAGGFMLLSLTGCTLPAGMTANEMNQPSAPEEDTLTVLDGDSFDAVSPSDELVVYDANNGAYAGSPILGTWVLLEDYEDGYDSWDNIAEYTSDGYVYEWYGDGLGYYDPLCCFDYDGEKLIYHYYASFGAPEDYDVEYGCKINGSSMTTTDKNGVSSEFLRISEEINLSVEQIKGLYKTVNE